MQVLLEKITEEPLLAAFAFMLDVNQPFISAAVVCGIQAAVLVPLIEFQITARENTLSRPMGHAVSLQRPCFPSFCF